MAGKPIDLFQPPPHLGKMRRDFTYIDDVVAGTIAAIDLKAPCEVFNLGNHQPEEVSQLVELLERYLGKKAQLVTKPMPGSDVPSTYADIDLSRSRLGFEPKTSLEDGLKKFIDWYLLLKSRNLLIKNTYA